MRCHFARFLPLVIIAALILAALTVARAEDVRTSARSVYIVDDQSGSVLLDRDSTARSEPASLTKMMTAYLAFEALKMGKIKLTDTLPVSEEARRMQGSRMFVERGSNVGFEDLLRGIIVQSDNDACVVVAEGLAGSEEAFVERMNAKAKQFGMMGTHFANSSGSTPTTTPPPATSRFWRITWSRTFLSTTTISRRSLSPIMGSSRATGTRCSTRVSAPTA